MGKIGPTGLQIWSKLFSQALGTLSSNTALIIANDFTTAFTKGALLKNFECFVAWRAATSGEGPILMGLCNGDLTVAEITSAIADNSLDPFDHTNMLASAEKLGVYWETFFIVDRMEENGSAHHKVSLGGGKGIPVGEEKGFQLFAISLDGGSLTTGSSLRGMYRVQGVWLGD